MKPREINKMDRLHQELHSTVELNNLLSLGDYASVYRCSSQFRILWFKLFSENREHHCTTLNSYEKNEELLISGWTGSILSTSAIIELIRVRINEAYQKKVFVQFDYFQCTCDIKLFELKGKDKVLYDKHYWKWFIYPVLVKLLRIGLSIEIQFLGKVKEINKHYRVLGKFMNHLTFHIPPLEIKTRENPSTKFYQLYLKGLFCDFSIVANDKSIISVHAIIFHITNENIVSTLSSDSKEDRIIHLDYSPTIIKAMVDFIYLGTEGITLKRVLDEKIDLNELFHLANLFADETLINHCTNLFDLLSTKDSLENLCLLVERYDNNHLRQLVSYYSQ